MTELQPHPPWKFWVGILFCFLQVAVGVPALGYLMIRGFETGSCGQECDIVSFGHMLYGFAIFGFAVALASIVLLVLLRRRTWAWTIPGVAVVIIVIGFLIVNSAADQFLMA